MRGHITILSGTIGSGKTTACRQLITRLQGQGLDCAGIVCPARFESERKAGIDLLNLRTGECRALAEADNRPATLRTGAYRFDTAVMAWGAACLNAACPCDVLFVDEIGPLELERGQGWVNALDVLRAGLFRLAVVVVRPALVDGFRAVLGDAPSTLFTLPQSQPADAIFSMLQNLPPH
jgi:nucleoside-triphosphatase THEP1